MSEPLVWGLLPKTQDDPTTIDEAIAAAVAAHVADPSAHLDTDQSLAVHRENEMLDHPAASVVSDKFSSANRPLIVPTSADVDVTFDNESGSALGFLARVDKNSPSTGNALAQMLNFQIADLGYASGDIVFDFLFSADNGSGTANAIFDLNFARIYLDNGHYKFGWYNGSWHYSTLTAFSQNIAQRWRVHYSAIDNSINFYLNGVLLFSQVQTPTFATSDFMMTVILNRGTTINASAYFGGITVGFST